MDSEKLELGAEARRQSLAFAARTRDPNSDEATVICELDAILGCDDDPAEWKS